MVAPCWGFCLPEPIGPGPPEPPLFFLPYQEPSTTVGTASDTGLSPATDIGTGKPRNKEEEWLSQIITRLNDLFVTDALSDKDLINYAYTIRDKISENESVMHQIANNSAEQALLGVCAAEAQAAGQDGSGVCGDVADWGHDGLGRGVADESGWLGGRREGRAGVPRSFHRRDGVGHGALRRPGGCAAA